MSDQTPAPGPVWATMPPEFWRIAYIVLGIFLVVMSLILLGCWALLSGRISMENGAALAAVAGLVGAIAGYAASNASTVLSTIYGSSIATQHSPRTVNAASAMINESPTEKK